MDAGPCPSCGKPPFSLGDYLFRFGLSLSRPCQHCGTSVGMSGRAWAGLLILLIPVGLILGWSLPAGWSVWASLGLGGLLGGVLGALVALAAWRFGWWRVASGDESSGE